VLLVTDRLPQPSSSTAKAHNRGRRKCLLAVVVVVGVIGVVVAGCKLQGAIREATTITAMTGTTPIYTINSSHSKEHNNRTYHRKRTSNHQTATALYSSNKNKHKKQEQPSNNHNSSASASPSAASMETSVTAAVRHASHCNHRHQQQHNRAQDLIALNVKPKLLYNATQTITTTPPTTTPMTTTRTTATTTKPTATNIGAKTNSKTHTGNKQ
jgi:hypothetical protein